MHIEAVYAWGLDTNRCSLRTFEVSIITVEISIKVFINQLAFIIIFAIVRIISLASIPCVELSCSICFRSYEV